MSNAYHEAEELASQKSWCECVAPMFLPFREWARHYHTIVQETALEIEIRTAERQYNHECTK